MEEELSFSVNYLDQNHDPAKIAALKNFFEKNALNSDLPPNYYDYMANMILEDPPRIQEDLFELIGCMIINGCKYTEDQARLILNDLFKFLQESKLTTHTVQSWRAEQLEAPIIMKNLMLENSSDRQSGYSDAFLGLEKYREENQFINIKDKKKEKLAEKQRLKEMEAKTKIYQDMKEQKSKLPQIEVRHNREKGWSRDIKLNNFSIEIGGKYLLENASLTLAWGRKYGLVGRNGIGKTTLLSFIARREIENMPPTGQILLVEQEVPGDDTTVLDTVLNADVERTSLLREEEDLRNVPDSDKEANEKLKRINERLQEIEAYKAESKAASILAGLGFTVDSLHQPTKTFSGGWRMRISLAKALFCEPDILFLDEPTNHLDLDAVMWLEDYTKKLESTVVIVSHARDFLNTVCTDIIHFENQKLIEYNGNYDTFEKLRLNRLQLLKKQRQNQQAKIAHLQSFIDRFRANANRASQAQSKIKAIERMDIIEEILDDPSCVFMFPNPDKLKPPILKLDDGEFSYKSDKPLLKSINFNVDMDSRIALVGANGVGKSTLLKLLVGQIELTLGNSYRNNKARISLFTQHHMDLLDPMLSPLEQFLKNNPTTPSEKIRQHLGAFGITGTLALRPIYLLSGGQKSRVSFALCAWDNPHIIIMDEPTNHLDMDAISALIVALENFQGGLVIVSHDQFFVSNICSSIYYIKSLRLKKFPGDFQDYRKALAANKL